MVDREGRAHDLRPELVREVHADEVRERLLGVEVEAALRIEVVGGERVRKVLAVHGLGRRLWGETVGLLAGLATAAYPLLVFFSGMLLTETLFALCLILAAGPVAAWWEKGASKYLKRYHYPVYQVVQSRLDTINQAVGGHIANFNKEVSV